MTIHEQPVTTDHAEFHVDLTDALTVGDAAPHDRLLRPCPDQRGIGDTAKRPAEGQPAHCLEKAGLALPVRAGESDDRGGSSRLTDW